MDTVLYALSKKLLSSLTGQVQGRPVACVNCQTGKLAAASPLAGFIAFVRTLAEHRWRERPLIVDPDGTMDPATCQSAVASFLRVRQLCAFNLTVKASILCQQKRGLLSVAHTTGA